MARASLRKLDAFVRPRPDMRTRSVVGGVITVVALSAAALLFVAQLTYYILGNPQHSLHLAISRSSGLRPINLTPHEARMYDLLGRTSNDVVVGSAAWLPSSIPLRLRITFPHLKCHRMDVTHDGASLSDGELSKHHPGHSIQLRKPTLSDLKPMGLSSSDASDGCTVEGEMRIPIVAGSLSISMNFLAWTEVTSMLALRQLGAALDGVAFKAKMEANFNTTHYIHYLRFGNALPTSLGQKNQMTSPLEQRYNRVHNEFGGLALEQIEAKLIPTTTTHIRSLNPFALLTSISLLSPITYYQVSVTDHQVQPATLVAHGVPQLPGLLVSYDFSPIAIRQHGGRNNILVFLSSLVSIVGGVFVTVGMLTSFLVHSAQAVAKKID